MCIICIKYKGQQPPTQDILTNMFNNNPDGAGLMYWKPNEDHIHGLKGFTKLADWLSACDIVKKDYIAVYHCRITTQGRSTNYTHPFPITENKEALTWRAWTGREGVAHNGIIPLTSSYAWSTEESDTALFIRNYWRKLFPNVDAYKDNARLDLLGECTNSRWAILTPARIYTAGEGWIRDKATGLYFSNSSFQTKQKYTYYDANDDYWTNYDAHTNKYLDYWNKKK